MSNVSYLFTWSPELYIELKTQDNQKLDFNRLLVKYFPSTKDLKQGGDFISANRESFVHLLSTRFKEEIEKGVSHASLGTLFKSLSQYLRWCDENNIHSFTSSSLEEFSNHQNNKVMLGKLKSSTYTLFRSNLTTLFTRFLDLPSCYFDNVLVRDKKDQEHFEAYTRSDLNQLLPFLRAVFKQTHRQFMDEPEKHINALKTRPTMIFKWQGMEYQLCAGISKMMSAATFLLAYYTYANTGDLFKLIQPKNASSTLGETWYTMPAFKRRSFKTIRVEMGGHDLEIPKYALSFFDNLLEASQLISNDENATLLQTVVSGKVKPMKPGNLTAFLTRWQEKHFLFTDQIGRKLRPVISRFRETGAQITSYYQGEMVSSIMLGNTPSVRKKHYSTGNRTSNNGMMQDTLAIREEQIKKKVNVQHAKENLGIDVLVIEKENKINIPNLSRTSNGGSCDDPFGEKSKKFTKKAQARGLLNEGERLACADLLACFGCSHQVIVQSVADIWCLLSFKACIEESLYLHLDADHYRKNFSKIIEFIESKILPKIHTKTRKQAEKKLDEDGFHPAWDEPESILQFISNSGKGG